MARQRRSSKSNSTTAAKSRKPRIPPDLLHKVPGKTKAERAANIKEYKQRGFRVEKDSVVVDGPRDSRRKKIKGSRVRVIGKGVVQTSVGQRRDYIIGFTKKEKQDFAAFPEPFIENKLLQLEKIFPSLRHRRNRQVRLQWGAYQATKDFAGNYFTAKYFATVSPEDKRRDGKKAGPRADKLTGLHIVVHIPKKKKTKKKTKGKKRAKGRKRK